MVWFAGSSVHIFCGIGLNFFTFTAGTDYTTPSPNPGPTPTQKPTIEVTIEDHNIGIYEVGSTVRYNCSARSQLAPRVR